MDIVHNSHIKALDILVMCSDHEGLPMTYDSPRGYSAGHAHCCAPNRRLRPHHLKGIVEEGLSTDYKPAAYASEISKLLNLDTTKIIELGQQKLLELYSEKANAEVTY